MKAEFFGGPLDKKIMEIDHNFPWKIRFPVYSKDIHIYKQYEIAVYEFSQFRPCNDMRLYDYIGTE